MRVAASVLALALVCSSFAQTRPHPYDLKHVRWQIALHPENSSLSGVATNVLVPTKGTKTITLDAIGMKVSSVTVDGVKAGFTNKSPILTVKLPKAGNGKKAMAVTIAYSTVPAAGVYFVPAKRAFPAKTPVVYSQGEMEDNRNWIPTYDYPDDKATSEGMIDVPAGWSALSNGKLIQKATKGGRSTFHWKIDVPHATYLISFVAGPYSEVVERGGKVPISAWAPKGLEPWVKAAFGKTAPIVDFYSKLTGQPYPYSKYAQAAVPDYMFGGMENISCTTQTITAIYPPSTAETSDATGLVAHELAHQWFGDYVTTNGWGDIWINEGWASFLPNFYVRESEGQEAYEISRYGSFQGAIGGGMAAPTRSMVNHSYKDPIDMFDGLAYPGGATRMFMLMDKLGEETFWKTCRAYLREKGKTSFDTKEFFRVWSKHSGQDLTEFMNQWFFTPGLPRIQAKTEGSKLMIGESNGKFAFDLPVWVWTGSDWRKTSVAVANGSGEVDLGADAGKPYVIDPELKVLATVSYGDHPSFESRLIMLENVGFATGKLQILDNLMRDLTPAQTAIVFHTPAMQTEAFQARWLGQVRDPNMEGEFLQMLDSASGPIKIAIANWLEGHSKGSLVGSRLLALAKSEKNPQVAGAFYSAALRLTDSDDLAESMWKMDSYNDGLRSRALGYWNGKNREKARKKALEAIDNGLPEPTRVTAVRMLGGLKDEKGSHRVYDALIKVAKEDSFGARNTAIDALANYGDAKALAVLQPLTKHPLVFLRNTAQSAVDRLSRAK